MAAVQRHPGDEHVTGWAVVVGAVPLLHNHYRVLHVVVHEVNLEVGARHRPPLTVPNWTPNGPGCSR